MTDIKEGLENLIGKHVVIYACRFIYTGKLHRVDPQAAMLTDAKIIYDTGAHDKKKKEWANVEDCWCPEWYVQIGSIESFGEAPF